MPTQIFVNLPVKDLNKTIDFFAKLGFKFNLQFTDASLKTSTAIFGKYFTWT